MQGNPQGGVQCTFSKSGPALTATGDIPTPWESQPEGVIWHNSLPFSLLSSRAEEYFRKEKLFIFVKTLRSGFSSVSRGAGCRL